jgi:UDP-N-acetyl-D-glucosamine dehydrogenase
MRSSSPPGHTVFDYDLVVDASSLVIDTRNATRSVTNGQEKIVRA